MSKTISKEIVWFFDSPGNHPPATMWYLVNGLVISNGRVCRETRIVYHEKGNGFKKNTDMQVDYWAELPSPL